MAIANILVKLLQMLGLKKSDVNKFDAVERQLRSARATNEDRLTSLKEKIASLERQALEKKAEYDRSTGDTQRIVGGEIERIFGDLDRLRGQENIIARNLDRLSQALAKLDEYRAAKEQGVGEDILDSLAIELEDAFADLKVTDRAADGLDRVKYEAPQTKPKQVDREGRMAELQGEQPVSEGISAKTAERLRMLEEE